VTFGALAVSGTGIFSTTASGAITLAALSVASTATFSTTASGAIALDPLSVAGAGTVSTADVVGAGDIALGSLATSSVGTFETDGIGSIDLDGLIVSGTAVSQNFDGTDVLNSVQSWWVQMPQAQALTADGLLWYLQAPEATPLPYATFFLVSEIDETWTTGYSVQRASVQVNFHANTASAARAVSKSFRRLIKYAPLHINSDLVMHVLPDGQGLQIGEGLAPDGQDCWMAYSTLDIPWTRPMSTQSGGPFDGVDVLSSIVAWLAGSLTPDHVIGSWPVWYDEAPEQEDAEIPYLTFELESEPVEVFTTGFAFWRSTVTVKLHAETAADARQAALNFRAAIEQQPLSIDGQAVLHILGDNDSIELGQGLGAGGTDVWIASETFDIPWTE
jgi:hypothetical protein